MNSRFVIDDLQGLKLSSPDEVIPAAEIKAFDPDQPRDADGKWTGDGEDGAADGDTLATSHAALTHEIKLIVKATAIVAAAALASLVLPEAVAGTFLVSGALAAADGIAFNMYVNAGLEAGKHALNDMGVSTSQAESLLHQVQDTTKGAPDAHDAKLLARLHPILVASAGLARDTAVAELKAKRPQTPQTLVDAIDTARDAYVAKLSGLAASKALVKYNPDQPRDALGRWASDLDDEADAIEAESGETATYKLSTGAKIRLAFYALTALGLGVAAFRKVPYRQYGDAFSAENVDFKKAMYSLFLRSIQSKVTKTEQLALVKYTMGDCRTINKNLRLGRKPTEQVDKIDSALRKSLLAENTVVYRGLNLSRSQRLLAKYGPGDIFVDKGFSSTSLSQDVARNYAAASAGSTSPKDGWVWSINIDQGARALPLIPKLTSLATSTDHEVLLARNSAFKILDIDSDSKTIYIQHAGLSGEILDPAPVATTNAADVATDERDEDGGDRFLVDMETDLDYYPAPDDDTTAVDFAGYRPPQMPAETATASAP